MPVATSLPATEELHKLFEYKNGNLYWRITKSGKAKAGSKVGSVNSAGYLTVGINYKRYLVHRIIWVMHGNEPVDLIDHINNDALDNRIENLRAANHVINTRNAKLRKDSTSGIKGVSWHKQTRKWVGQLWHEHKIYKAGSFDDKDECAAAVRALRESLHGEFACHG
jgi:hypothetical protein